jgi:cysteine desulfurase/selenocysteine lyase
MNAISEMALNEFNVAQVRKDFPILEQKVNGKQLIYFDNGATTQKPIQVLNAVEHYYKHYNSNVHRGVHTLSRLATDAYEEARITVQNYINAESSDEVIFTRGTTTSINTVANGFGRRYLQAGDEVLISAMEHHANIVPWQIVCEEKGATLKVIPVLDNGELDYSAFLALLNSKVKIVAITHISNVLGTINPIEKIIRDAHQAGAKVLIDAAQSIQHHEIDVQKLNCDFLCFSGHKIYAPAGIGVLYGKKEILNEIPPFEFGGDMIREVSFEKTTFNDLPYKFEAGTPNIEGAVGLSAALKYINQLGLENIRKYEENLSEYASKQLRTLKNYYPIGDATHKAGVFSFIINGTHPSDVGTLLDQFGIAVRTGHHCAQPLMNRFGIPGTVRVSLAFYNKKDEIDYLVESLLKAEKMLT